MSEKRLSKSGLNITQQESGMRDYYLHPHNLQGKWFRSKLERAAKKKPYEAMGYMDLVAMPEENIEKLHEILRKARENVINDVSSESIHPRGFFPLDLIEIDTVIRSKGFKLIEGKNDLDSNHIGLDKNITLWYFLPKKNLVLKFDDDNSTHGTSDLFMGFVTDVHVTKISKGIPFVRCHKTFHYMDKIQDGSTVRDIGNILDRLNAVEGIFRKHRNYMFTFDEARLFESGVADFRHCKSRLYHSASEHVLKRLPNIQGVISGKDLFTTLYMLYVGGFKEHSIVECDGKFSYVYNYRSALNFTETMQFTKKFENYVTWYTKKFKR